MGIFSGTVKSVKVKSNASGSYLGVIARGVDHGAWLPGEEPAPFKAWFAAPMSTKGELVPGATVDVEYVTAASGTGIMFLKRATVREIEGSKVEKLAPAGPKATSLGSFEGVYELMHRAKENLKRPAIRLKLASGLIIKLYVAGPASKYHGEINVVEADRAYPNGAWYGRIDAKGNFIEGRAKAEGLVDMLKALAEEPETVAATYGQLTGSCCFCAKALTDERSVKVGYGPVCAGNYGLPWGGKE